MFKISITFLLHVLWVVYSYIYATTGFPLTTLVAIPSWYMPIVAMMLSVCKLTFWQPVLTNHPYPKSCCDCACIDMWYSSSHAVATVVSLQSQLLCCYSCNHRIIVVTIVTLLQSWLSYHCSHDCHVIMSLQLQLSRHCSRGYRIIMSWLQSLHCCHVVVVVIALSACCGCGCGCSCRVADHPQLSV